MDTNGVLVQNQWIYTTTRNEEEGKILNWMMGLLGKCIVRDAESNRMSTECCLMTVD